MPKFTIERSHSLPIGEVRPRLQALSDMLAAKFGLTVEWKSPTEADVRRTGASGKITCEPNKVSVLVDLSFAFTPIRGKVEERVRAELEKALA